MVISSDAVSRKEKPCRSKRKERHHHHPHGDGRPPGKVSAHKARKSGTIPPDKKQAPYRKADLVSKTNYTIRKAPYAHLDSTMRQTLERAWNACVRAERAVSIRSFALTHGVKEATWRRELKRGATGALVRADGRWRYPEYSAALAQSKVDAGKANMGAGMRMTAQMANRLRILIVEQRRSPYDAREILARELPGRRIPCLRTVYNHIDAGDMGVSRGETPYHPGRKRRPKRNAHPAKVLPNRRRISERPKEADDPAELGHKEFDTIVSCAGGRGGLLVDIDKCSLKVALEPIGSISRRAVSLAFLRMKRRGAIDEDLKTATTDNGCEVSHQKALERILGCPVYYTRAYASYEKGAVENVNRIIRRWFPKGTDFSKVSREDVLAVEAIVNSIHRLSLKGESAHEYHSRMAKAA